MSMNANVETDKKLGLGGLMLMAIVGLGIVFASGHVQASTIHDAAHDMRHALGFPCH